MQSRGIIMRPPMHHAARKTTSHCKSARNRRFSSWMVLGCSEFAEKRAQTTRGQLAQTCRWACPVGQFRHGQYDLAPCRGPRGHNGAEPSLHGGDGLGVARVVYRAGFVYFCVSCTFWRCTFPSGSGRGYGVADVGRLQICAAGIAGRACRRNSIARKHSAAGATVDQQRHTHDRIRGHGVFAGEPVSHSYRTGNAPGCAATAGRDAGVHGVCGAAYVGVQVLFGISPAERYFAGLRRFVVGYSAGILVAAPLLFMFFADRRRKQLIAFLRLPEAWAQVATVQDCMWGGFCWIRKVTSAISTCY